ncbi:IclR family transcriptional regulator [Rathayibacter sp. VKM Ac-2857]|uniref:IclR family transcriptional regulator n=1 Tax=Rathayibacter sp. VKM Ac-2857 TaxID=2739020 RepID=UPI001563BC08|nr:IclR family transcriptional regulator [Rathayibacter sp. VKM Ac-2857]NQX18292.1 IclR family transcriptional regulator [Rathayibacter sp. VKM Ac-2857]
MALADDVAHGMRVLEMLAPEPEGLRVTQVAEALGLNKAIAHRLLGALVTAGYAAQDPRTSTYYATHRLGALGLRQLSSSGVSTWAQRTLDALAAESEELVRLAVVSEDSLQWIAKAQGSNSSLRLDPVMGKDAVPYATASGKAWLSTLPEEHVREILDQHGLVPLTSRTVLEPEKVLDELHEVRHRGYATTLEEMDLGIHAVAAPVLGAGSHAPATGTISIAGPSVRMTRARMAELSRPLLLAAAEITASWPTYAYLAGEEDLSA